MQAKLFGVRWRGVLRAPLAGIVVLGCRVSRSPRSAFDRRAVGAVRAFESLGGSVVVASGGRTWDGVVEADALAERLLAMGVPPESVVRERCSLSTRENAAFSARLLARRGVGNAIVVTCDWHLPRAVALFEREGLVARGFGSGAHEAGWLAVGYRKGREWVACRLDRVKP